MGDLRDLPQAELDVMNVLWGKGEATVKEILGVLGSERKIAYNTVATLLTRLRDKGYVEARERNFAYVYRPLVAREQVVKRKLDDLVARVLGGDIAPLAAYIAQNRGLNEDQIAALEDIINSSEAGEEGEDGK